MVKITCRDAKLQCSCLFLTYFLIIQSLTIDFSQDLHSKLDYFNWHRKVIYACIQRVLRAKHSAAAY